MAEPVALTSLCASAPASDEILLPRGKSVPSDKRLLVSGNDRLKLMRGGVRADNGEAACVSGATLAFFGGDEASVSYRGVGFWQIVWRDAGLRLAMLISALTLVGTVISAYNTYLKSTSKDAGSFTGNTAVVALVIAFALAVLKLVQDYRKL